MPNIAECLKIIKKTMILGFGVDSDLLTGFIILGIVNLTLGVFANVIFKRQAYTERSLRDLIRDSNSEPDKGQI